MSEHHHQQPQRSIERYCEVAVVGGSVAGLAGALLLGRQRRSVIVIDSASPRNAVATHMHGYLGREAVAPAELTATGREEVRSYGGEVLAGSVEQVTRDGSRFRVELQGGGVLFARRVLAATGLVDLLPDIEGLAEQWGQGVIHCPFCHGYEVRDQPIAQIITHPMGLHAASLFRQLSAEMTLLIEDGVEVDDSELALLENEGVPVLRARVKRVLTDQDGHLCGLQLNNGQRVPAGAVAVEPGFRARAEAFAALGLHTAAHESGLGDVVGVDTRGETSIPGLYAAGNLVDPSQQVSGAAADGSRVAAMICFDLAREGLISRKRSSGNQEDWDHRYSGEQMWSGNPNGTLCQEATGLAAGRALDVGAGEGGDALWLATQGWKVTASDISERVLERIRFAAQSRQLEVDCLHADANTLGAFGVGGFDLVSAQYASIPRTPDQRAVRNICQAVAAGGTLIVVSHDLAALREPMEPDQGARAFDPDAFVRVEDFVEFLSSSEDWRIETQEKRPRPPGAASASHHMDDLVLRARRVSAAG